MAYPPSAIAADKVDATGTFGDHPGHHNALANAVNDIVAELGTNPAGPETTVAERLAAAFHGNVTGEIAALTAKTTPVGGDLVVIEDSAASNEKKQVTVTSLLAALGQPVYTSDLPTGTNAAGSGNLGDNVTALGYQAAKDNPATGDQLTALGRAAGANLVTPGTYNTMIGDQAGTGSANHQQSTLVGGLAGNNADLASAGSITAIGYAAGASSTGGTATIVGSEAAYQNAGGSLVAMGYRAAYNNTGTQGVAVGREAGHGNTGDNMTAVGYLAGQSNSGALLTALGRQAGWSNSGVNLQSLGYQAGYQNAGDYVTALGEQAAYANPATGDSLTAVGRRAGVALITPGTYNTVIGALAADGATNAAQLTAVGGYAAYQWNPASASPGVAVGYEAGYQNTGTGLSAVGYRAAKSNTGASVTALGYQAGSTNTYSAVILIGQSAAADGASMTVLGSASIPNLYLKPNGNDLDTYFDIATADTVKHYAGGQKVLEVNETGGAPCLGFFGTAAVAKPTGVAVSAAGIHAALVTLGLIAA